VIAGRIESWVDYDNDVYLVKTDANGNVIWEKSYGDTNYDAGHSLELTTDGGFIIGGVTETGDGKGEEMLLLKTDANGDTLWMKQHGGVSYEIAYSVQQTMDGGYILAGLTGSFDVGGGDIWLVRTDAFGDTLWTRSYGGAEEEQGYSVRQTTDGGYIIAGSADSFGPGEVMRAIWLVRTDAFGDTLWTRAYGGSWEGEASSVIQTSDGGYVATGQKFSSGEGEAGDALVLRMGAAPAAVEGPTSGSSLLKIACTPNPSRGSVRIECDLRGAGHVRICVYDVSGRVVRSLHNGIGSDGSQVVTWDGTDSRGERVGEGVYFCCVHSESEVTAKKLVLLE
jgi:hypothetical protein